MADTIKAAVLLRVDVLRSASDEQLTRLAAHIRRAAEGAPIVADASAPVIMRIPPASTPGS
jgi:hypothetical protein